MKNKLLFGIITVVLFSASLPGVTRAQMMGNYFSYPGDYSMMGYGDFSSGWVGILWWVLIIVGAVLLVRWAVGQLRSQSGNQGKTALGILKDQYAKGEIDRKEFEEEKKKDLND